MLKGKNVSKRFGGVEALRNVDFQIGDKEIVGLIGPNGAGKTTLFNVISGIHRPDKGEITFCDKNIVGLKPFEIRRMGIGRTFQIMRPFLKMTVLENVLVASIYGRNGLISMQEARNEALECLEFVGLEDKKAVPALNLTLAQRRALEIARALAAKPKLVLLDEVVAGLNPIETLDAMNLVKKIRDELGLSVLWVEHVMKAIMNVCQRVIVLHQGEKIAEGPPQAIAKDENVIKAYLGDVYAHA
ncbi:MAG: ABC transporter ATP-binding protein [Nitrososphaerota archaeon]|nr:ABC transporter ATP-binding protein [Candidatus Bathyarchaeota archaeon]MDW8024009.1 ABC transporter ATP-binding protein [Nitrososphaerota archaeon]